MERLAARVLWLSEEPVAAVTDSDGRQEWSLVESALAIVVQADWAEQL